MEKRVRFSVCLLDFFVSDIMKYMTDYPLADGQGLPNCVYELLMVSF